MLTFLMAIDISRCLKLELKREKIIQIFKLVQVSIITLMMFGLSLVSSYIHWIRILCLTFIAKEQLK